MKTCVIDFMAQRGMMKFLLTVHNGFILKGRLEI